jgi:hypothetical protein
MFGYVKEKSTDRIISYWDLKNKPTDTDELEYFECIESEKPPVYEPEPALVYNPNTLISWAMSQIFTEALIPHFAAFLDFANKANDESCANFLAYATAVNLLEEADIIIDKAIELGANITIGD